MLYASVLYLYGFSARAVWVVAPRRRCLWRIILENIQLVSDKCFESCDLQYCSCSFSNASYCSLIWWYAAYKLCLWTLELHLTFYEYDRKWLQFT